MPKSTSPQSLTAHAAQIVVRQSKEFYNFTKENGTKKQMDRLFDQCFEAVDVMIEAMPVEASRRWPINLKK